MSCTNHQFKQGVTFNGAGTYATEAGWPANLTGVTIVTALRDSRNKLHYLDVAITSPTTFTVLSKSFPRVATTSGLVGASGCLGRGASVEDLQPARAAKAMTRSVRMALSSLESVESGLALGF